MAVETSAVQGLSNDWVTDTLLQVAALERRLADPAALAELTRKLTEAGRALGASSLVPASALAGRILAAMPPPNANHLNGTGLTVVVEGYLATGVQVVRAAGRARAEGAKRIRAIAVKVNPVGAAFVADELGAPVVVLEP
jgi:hypothetical protein